MKSIHRARPASKPGREESPRPPSGDSCRLRLAIGDASYSVRPIRPGRFASLKSFRLRQAGGESFDVSELLIGRSECTCGERAESEALCVHVRALRACGLIGGCPVRPVNCHGSDPEPRTLEQSIRDESRAYGETGTPMGAFLSRQLDRLAQLIRFTGAETGEDFEARFAVMEDDVRDEAFRRGYNEGQNAGLRQAFRYQEALD